MYLTVPLTYEPTGAVVSGLIVPVASTDATTLPRVTVVVMYFVVSRRRNARITIARARMSAMVMKAGRFRKARVLSHRMDLSEVTTSTRLALDGMAKNKLRTGLAMLGIAIGIAAFIATVSIGEGGSQRVRNQLQNLGDNFVWVEAGSRNVQGVRTGSGNNKTLVFRDEETIVQTIPLIKMCSPQVDSRTQVIAGNVNWNTTYRGVTPEFLHIRRSTIYQGSMFTQRDVATSANVCVLGKTVAEQLFEGQDPIGKTVRIRDLPFHVTGVLQRKGETATGQDQDDQMFIPFTTAMHKIKGVSWLDDVMCSATTPEAIRPA